MEFKNGLLINSSQTQQIQKKEGAFKKATPINHRLPSSSVSEVLWILEALETDSVNETIELATFGEEHGLDADDLFAIMEVMEILEFAHIRKGKIKLTSEGVSFSNANIQMQKKIFATQLLTHVELAMYIVKQINKAQNKIIEKDGVKIMGESNILNRLPVSASSLYAKNMFNFVDNLFDKESKKLNINLEDEIIEKTLIK